MHTEELFDALLKMLAAIKAENFLKNVGDVEVKALVMTMPHRLAEAQAKTPGDTVQDVETDASTKTVVEVKALVNTENDTIAEEEVYTDINTLNDVEAKALLYTQAETFSKVQTKSDTDTPIRK